MSMKRIGFPVDPCVLFVIPTFCSYQPQTPTSAAVALARFLWRVGHSRLGLDRWGSRCWAWGAWLLSLATQEPLAEPSAMPPRVPHSAPDRHLSALAWGPIRPADEIYNAKVGEASSPEKPKEVSSTKNCFLPLSFISASSQDQLR